MKPTISTIVQLENILKYEIHKPIYRFPMDLDVRCKATLIGCAFLIDYMFFEKKANNESDGFGMAS